MLPNNKNPTTTAKNVAANNPKIVQSSLDQNKQSTNPQQNKRP